MTRELKLREDGLKKLSKPIFAKFDSKIAPMMKRHDKWEVVKNRCATANAESNSLLEAQKCLDDGISDKKGRMYWKSWLKSFSQVFDLTAQDERMALDVANAYCLDLVNR